MKRRLKTHFAVRDEDGEWRTACGAPGVHTSSIPGPAINCWQCESTKVYRAALLAQSEDPK